ncbi:methylated-DNA--[protein]-cysteine S-methyltransferase [Bdellovibrio bacteriovorus]|uniref:methylated-DNA--[protein]-cysteine S-methyltransferase n=1 Tax=Bdellovibrio bacteriovorus TaxID=959 RepID=UPI001E60DC21|nr:methylated-DNA--[protein]-cysteine S-methyltransferase [Bdellovibrio bacteriovorus]
MNLLQWKMSSPLGDLYMVASEKGLQSLYWEKTTGIPLAPSLTGKDGAVKILKQTETELTEYFKGQRQDFDVPLDVVGTEFQESVWRQLKKIPYGKTVSYTDIARRIKKEKAVRAVGTANGKNPICIIVPCHRVIAAGGGLGGYSGAWAGILGAWNAKKLC